LPFRSLWTTLNAVDPRRSQERKRERGRERLSLDARRKTIYKKRTHTEKTDEALGSLQEGEGVDALIGDGNLCEGLEKEGAGRSELSDEIKSIVSKTMRRTVTVSR
jgi:hypothetical protein